MPVGVGRLMAFSFSRQLWCRLSSCRGLSAQSKPADPQAACNCARPSDAAAAVCSQKQAGMLAARSQILMGATGVPPAAAAPPCTRATPTTHHHQPPSRLLRARGARAASFWCCAVRRPIIFLHH